MTMAIDFDELRHLATQTQNLPAETWKTTKWHDELLRLRDGFMQLVQSHPSACFDEFKDHPFWLNWASKGSLFNNNILYFAIGGASDPLWIERLSSVGVSAPSHFIRQVCSQKIENIVPVLKICNRLGFVQLSENAEYQHLFRYFVGRGSGDFINYMWENNLFTQRFNGATNDLAVFASKKLFNGNRTELLKKLWEKWGHPTADEYRQLIAGIENYALSGNSSRGNAYQFVASHWNFNHPEWNNTDSKLHLKSLFRKGASEQVAYLLREKIKNGWFSEDVWSETLSEMILKPENKDAFAKLYLEHVATQLTPSARVKRM